MEQIYLQQDTRDRASYAYFQIWSPNDFRCTRKTTIPRIHSNQSAVVSLLHMSMKTEDRGEGGKRAHLFFQTANVTVANTTFDGWVGKWLGKSQMKEFFSGLCSKIQPMKKLEAVMLA